MKLNNFFEKGHPIRKDGPQFTLTNGRLEEDLEQERLKTNELEQQNIDFLAEQDILKKNIAVLEENRKTLTQQLDENTETLKIRESAYTEAQTKAESIPALQHNIKQLTAEKDSLTHTLENAKANSLQQNNDLSSLQTQYDNIMEENMQFRTEIEQNRKDVISFKVQAEQFKEKFEGTQSVMNTLTTEYKDIQHSRNNLWDQAVYWEAKAEELGERVESIEAVEAKLRTWVDSLQGDSSEAKSASKYMEQRFNKLTVLVSDMSKTISDLTSDKDHLSQVNSALKKELAKPKFMSMGAIAKREGFIMPTGKENIRTKYLGTAAPTLLKFKTKEENNAR